mmetsp:Transcript_46890/g.84123  ORF Transcript_46890/g.84123 Transcript_46890/m.84123 type:complete len:381 (-) Transcript_46890:101-1243(-)
MAAMADFASLPQEDQEKIRQKQKEAKRQKKAAKKQRGECTFDGPRAMEESGGEPFSRWLPDRTDLQLEEYFGACPAGIFKQAGLKASEENLEFLLGLDFNQVVGRFKDGSPVRLSAFNYFQFDGTDKEIWDPTFLARLAYEGFFTITTGRRREREPLPELQPYYGVLDWQNFNRSKPVNKALKRVKADSPRKYYLYCDRDLELTYKELDRYQKEQHGENWMTWKYLQAFQRASDDASINFRLHSIELYDGPLSTDGAATVGRPSLVAGEIGYSIGRIYTSLSGFSCRTTDGLGWIQLACLGKWLEDKKYAFWSLGHCYSPQMEYKRQLGHRIYTREEFLQRLKEERGPFRCSADDMLNQLGKGEEFDLDALSLLPDTTRP